MVAVDAAKVWARPCKVPTDSLLEVSQGTTDPNLLVLEKRGGEVGATVIFDAGLLARVQVVPVLGIPDVGSNIIRNETILCDENIRVSAKTEDLRWWHHWEQKGDEENLKEINIE